MKEEDKRGILWMTVNFVAGFLYISLESYR